MVFEIENSFCFDNRWNWNGKWRIQAANLFWELARQEKYEKWNEIITIVLFLDFFYR